MATLNGIIAISAALLVLLLIVCARAITAEEVLHLLNLVPYPDNRTSSGWDKGLELIPAGELAVEQVNSRPDVLPGYRLELVNVKSDACGISMVTNSLFEFYKHLIDEHTNVAGLVGLFCSTVTTEIAPLSSHPGIDIIPVSASTSPAFENRMAYPHLYRTISSSLVYNQALLKLMNTFNWNRISVVHNSHQNYYLSISNNFVLDIMGRNSSLELVSEESISQSSLTISAAINDVLESGGRIVYASVTELEAALLMCEVYRRNYIWPAYVFVFHDRLVEQILGQNVLCSYNEMLEAIEGIFLLHFRLERDADDILVSGLAYREFRELYAQRLADFAGHVSTNLTRNPYANILHDQVWAIALALNNSLESLFAMNLDLADYGLGNHNVTNVVATELSQLSFQGATGLIDFGEGVGTSVDIFQVRDGEAVLVGIYNPYQDNVELIENISHIPADRFETVHLLLPLGVTITFILVCAFCYIFTTTILVIFLWLRKRPEIRATSPYLSLLMFVGCYLLFTGATLQTLYRSVVVVDSVWFTVMCNMELWFDSLGITLIFGALLVRLLRIFYVFTHFGKTSQFWSDKFLFLAVIVICTGEAIIMTIWTSVDHVHQEITEIYVYDSNPPYYQLLATCSSENGGFWTIIATLYPGTLLLLILLLAIQTRHIKLENFKDTKKVNGYIFAVIISATIVLPLWFICKKLFIYPGSDIAHFYTFVSVALLCQFFLFAPKLLPLLLTRRKQHSTTFRGRQFQFSRSTF